MSEKLYQKVAKNYIKSGQFPFPISDTMSEILRTLLTAEQAKFLLLFTRKSYNIEELKQKTDLEGESLTKMLDSLLNIGAVVGLPSRSTGIMVYRLPPFFPGVLEFTLMKGTSTEKDKKFAKLWQIYFREIIETFQNSFDTMIPYLEKQTLTVDEIVPVNEEIKIGEEKTYKFEDLTEMINNQETIALATCYCRHRKDLLGEPCKRTKLRKNCFGFGKTAEFLIAHDFAEEISGEKALEILKQCEEDGLVHKAFHTALDPRREIDALCNCCQCCCGTFDNHFAGGLPLMSMTSYRAKVRDEECVSCGNCIEICNAKAIELIDTIAVINEEQCLGCGLCVTHCPENAIELQRINPKRVFVPPPRIKTEP